MYDIQLNRLYFLVILQCASNKCSFFPATHFGGLLEKLLAFGGVDLKVGGGDDDEHEEEEEYDEDVLWASRLAMASKKLRAIMLVMNITAKKMAVLHLSMVNMTHTE